MPGTVLDLITSAMRLLGVLAQGETPSNSEAVDSFDQLNRLLTSWNTERLNIYTVKRESFPLSALDGTYTIGVGADFNTARPVAIRKANVVTSTGLTVELEVLSDEKWAAVMQKTAQAPLPERLYNDGAYPQSTINLHPVPTQAGSSLELYSWQQLASYAALTDPVDLPPGYEHALRYNLAVCLAPEFGVPLDATVAATAAQAKASLRALNLPPTPGAAQDAAAKQQSAQAAVPQAPQAA